MRFPSPLIPARLVRRYKRFLADIVIEETGLAATAHCPNPGAMLGLARPDTRIWVEPNDDPKKKLKFGWRLVELPGGHVAGIDTSVPNRVVGEALRDGSISKLSDYGTVRPEVPYGAKSRVDFLLSEAGLPDAYVEVKNVHLLRQGTCAEFPDSVTARGARHLRELASMVEQGHRAILIYLVQRTDCTGVALADDLDPAYCLAFDAAVSSGVEVVCLGTEIDVRGVRVDGELPFLRVRP